MMVGGKRPDYLSARNYACTLIRAIVPSWKLFDKIIVKCKLHEGKCILASITCQDLQAEHVDMRVN
jgi:hypothetical protein